MSRTSIVVVSSLCIVALATDLSSAKPPLQNAPATEIIGGRPQVTWQLTNRRTAKELADGSELVFDGSSPMGIRTPTAKDFRLEQLRPVRRWIPMIFGRESGCEVVPPNGAARSVRFHLRAPQHDAKDAVARVSKKSIPVYAEAPLHTDAAYRLTWVCHFIGKSNTVSRHCEFKVEGAGLPNAKAADPSLPKRYYRVEIVYRRDESKGVLFLGQLIVPRPRERRYDIQAVGFSAAGKHVAPPDPGRQRPQLAARTVASKGWRVKPPLALRTRTHGAMWTEPRNGRKGIYVHVSDTATGASLPMKKGTPTFTLFSNALFRIEELTTNLESLRQDPVYWKERIQQIAAEATKSRTADAEVRQWVRQNIKMQPRK